MGDLAKRFTLPALHATKQTAEEFVAAQFLREASEELATAESALAKLQKVIASIRELCDDADFNDGLAKKVKEEAALQEKVVRLKAKED